ncbi:hypothetical protein M8C21_016930, partial [Ambrosia artemisiifolia]
MEIGQRSSSKVLLKGENIGYTGNNALQQAAENDIEEVVQELVELHLENASRNRVLASFYSHEDSER